MTALTIKARYKFFKKFRWYRKYYPTGVYYNIWLINMSRPWNDNNLVMLFTKYSKYKGK
jgi:hypothetical protein